MQYFDKFPGISYDIAGSETPNYDFVTNILIRIGILNEVKNNSVAYYEYLIREQDTPDNLAERLYGNSEFHWIILLTNNHINPHFDWPRNSDMFAQYIVDKYGDIPTAKSTIHHYEKTIRRTDLVANVTDEVVLIIDEDAYDALPESSYEVETLQSGKSIEVTITRAAVSAYDWENNENEKLRSIKVLKKELVPQIVKEFQKLMYDAGVVPQFSRRIVR